MANLKFSGFTGAAMAADTMLVGFKTTDTTTNYKYNVTQLATGLITALLAVDTGFTTGSVLFIGAGGIITQDNTNFFWDDTATAKNLYVAKRKFTITAAGAGNANGDIVYFGTGTTVAGTLYHFKSDGSWEITVCTSAAACDGLIAMALGTTPGTHGMLLRGMGTVVAIEGTEAVGDILYLSETTNGAADCVAPAATGEIVTIIGYCLHATDLTIWFDPSPQYIELA